eukprot:symbB.v1.2.033656.t1/scaffold4210.1/size43044/2
MITPWIPGSLSQSRQGWTTGAFFAESALRNLLDLSMTAHARGQLHRGSAPRKDGKHKGPKPALPKPPQVLSLFGESSGVFAAWKGAKVTCAIHSQAKDACEALELLATRNECGAQI